MKFPDFLRRKPAAEIPKGEAGSDTVEWYEDVMGGGPDVNPDLTGWQKFDQYWEMSLTDASVKSLLMFVTLPVRSALWTLEARSDDPGDRLIRDMVAWNLGLEGELGHLDLSWDEQLQQALKICTYGPMFEELVWDFERGKPPTTWRDADGDEHDVIPLARLGPRWPRSLLNGKVKTKGSKIVSIQQAHPDARPIPGEKLSYLIYEREGGRWDGISMLRPAWGPWRVKKGVLISAGVGFDRFSMGLPVVYHPDTHQAELRAREIGRDIRAHERGYAHLPVPEGEAWDATAWHIELMNAAQTIADPVNFLRWLSHQVLETGIANFSQLGLTESGNRATAETQIDPFFLAVQSLAGYLRRERERQVIRAIVRMNFGDAAAEERCPKLSVSKIQARSITTIVNSIATLNDAGFVITAPDDIEDLRELLGLSKLPNDLEQAGVPREQFMQVLQSLGLDPALLSAIVNALPPELGVARNRVPAALNGGRREGEPLPR